MISAKPSARVEQPQASDAEAVAFRDFLRALVAKELANFFNDTFSVAVNPQSTTTVQITVSPEQTFLMTQMRAFFSSDHALTLTIESEGYIFWDDPDVAQSVYSTPVDLVEQSMLFPSTRVINISMTNSTSATVNANFLFFGLQMITTIWESVHQTYFDDIIEAVVGRY